MKGGISAPFIRFPVATTLIMVGILFLGIVAYPLLGVAPLPQVDFPVILVQAQMAGASPETMATTVAAPLERRLGAIADVTEMTSTSSLGSVRLVLMFGLNRDIDGAARDVQAAINAVHTDARDARDTDWSQVVALYDQLVALDPSPVVALNRAVALAEVDGPIGEVDRGHDRQHSPPSKC